LIGYSDADWGGDVDQFKSTSGCAFLLNDSAILWRSKEQSYIALSTIEAKYVACSAATQDVVWLKKILVSFENCQISIRPSDNLL